MTRIKSASRGLAIIGMLSLLAACAQPMGRQAGASGPYSNPPPVPPGPGAVWFHVPFDTASSTISPAGKSTIDAVALSMQQNPNTLATIVGKTDTVGSAEYNMHLSHLRADTVRDALVYGGRVDAARVETRWTGETRLAVQTGDNVPDPDNRVVNIAVH